MRKNKELFFWSGLLFVIQVAMLLLHSTQFSKSEVYQPLRYLYGDGYDLEGFNALEQNMWLINLALYCIISVRKIVQCREENSYMTIARFPSFRKYYQSTYYRFIGYSFAYQLTVFLGAIAGYEIIRTIHTVDKINWLYFVLSQFCLLMGNLFFGSIIFYAILHKNAIKWAIVCYPGIPVFSLFSKEYLPKMVSNFIPGSWMMLARSRLFSEEGFFLWVVFLIEIVVFALVSCAAICRKIH